MNVAHSTYFSTVLLRYDHAIYAPIVSTQTILINVQEFAAIWMYGPFLFECSISVHYLSLFFWNVADVLNL